MRRGFEAVLTQIDGLAGAPLPDALRTVGTTLVMKVGGASGPLYGTLFMTLGKELPAARPGTSVRAFGAAITAVKKVGDPKWVEDDARRAAPAHDELAGWRQALRSVRARGSDRRKPVR
jgi:dihydroxyacetone kinase